MSRFSDKLNKVRFAIEVVVLLSLAIYVTVQAGELRSPQAAPTISASTVPELLNYQGYLTDSSGTPLDGSYQVTFSIYDAPSGGNQLWTETQAAVQVSNGRIAALLGGINPISPMLFVNYKDTFIGVKVGSDSEMTPRQRVHSVPYALHADDGVPAGTIIAYYPPMGNSGTCPAGYVLADGANGTPNLQGKFLRGAGAFPEGGSGVAGDNANPTHQHRVNGYTGEGGWPRHNAKTEAGYPPFNEASHNHYFDVTSYAAYAISPYYVVNFCIKQ